jgi:3-hydroxy-9,10-secoandrosta-1,3,5(10)-triene-9,17-dione monooxygenase reductase component
MPDTMIDPMAFRRSLGRFATGVTIITTLGPGAVPVGMTCNSFSSLSLDPPLVQWSIAKTSRNHAAIGEAPHFAVHVLDARQMDMCRQFAATAGDRFAGVKINTGLYGLPLLTTFHARFECERVAAHDAGDHTIIVGHVLRLEEQEGEPLLFYRGEFVSISFASSPVKDGGVKYGRR